MNRWAKVPDREAQPEPAATISATVQVRQATCLSTSPCLLDGVRRVLIVVAAQAAAATQQIHHEQDAGGDHEKGCCIHRNLLLRETN